MHAPEPAARAIQDTVSTPDQVAGEVKRKRRKRTSRATIERRIEARARERQAAWAETGRRDLTEALTRKLGQDFSELRKTDPPKGDPYEGRVSGVSR